MELTDEQQKIILAVLQSSHDYYTQHPEHKMPAHCMHPDELMMEIANALKHGKEPAPWIDPAPKGFK